MLTAKINPNLNFGQKVVFDGIKTTDKNNQPIVVIKEEKDESLVRKAFHVTANVQKVGAVATEGTKGVILSTLGGLAVGGGVLGVDWLITKANGKGLKAQSLFGTPIKAVGGIIGGIFKKIAKLPNKTVLEIITYPFYQGPKSVYNYMKNIQGISKLGKTLAVTAGLAAVGLGLAKTVINVNRKTADIDHGYRVGHRQK
ncbi:MAG: hypothetical protein PHX18_00285 [Candidatus Gastranaerophilales bacterium]|nr:hypothetical protein [Candidatus Gastranaerophilales bacterium]